MFLDAEFARMVVQNQEPAFRTPPLGGRGLRKRLQYRGTEVPKMTDGATGRGVRTSYHSRES